MSAPGAAGTGEPRLGTGSSFETGPHRETRQGLETSLLDGLSTGRAVSPDVRSPSLTLDGAYAMAERIRAAQVAAGARTIGRKVGFTNAETAAAFGAPGPVWGWVYDRDDDPVAGDGTRLHSLAGYAEPRLEPEIVLGLTRMPRPDMDAEALASCIGWAALGFEIVQSVFPGWRFTAAEAVAGFGLHGALLVGPKVVVGGAARAPDELAGVGVELRRNDEAVARGVGSNALGGPLSVLRWLVAELDRGGAAPLRAGEVVTTGTLTGAHPIEPGETWSVWIDGAGPPRGLAVRFR